ncbi:winged helix-turn-helix transcriptional regulator [Jannaschia sp. LMIT008]|uniref:winged helix-turn-helix transcriptional regulator n=1 Tax=Jannaschia maritima TaxID=3032585 RepID=UPI002810C571|nr:winged helix-turn-helix transcriptional regulator [Jannaschia sp. LMIT008]
MDIASLVNVSSRAWSLAILAALASGTPGRQAALLTRTGAGRTALAASLRHLIDLQLVERNPGHGHPLRPEYRLTPTGKTVGATAVRIMELASGRADAALIRRTWTLPILAVTERPRRFGEVRSALDNVSDRALAASLRDLEEHTWLRRRVDVAERPPRPTYEAIGLGAQLSNVIGIAETRC